MAKTVKKINVGLVGYKFMGKAHSHAYKDMPMFFDADAVPVMKAICGRNEEAVREAAEKWGWEGYETSWERLVARPDIDLVDISTPGDSHKDIAIAAAQNGKHVFSEKPLANDLSEAREMLAAVQKAGVTHMIGFTYRFCPAVQLAKKLISEGTLGKIYHVRAQYLQDWIIDPDFPLVWRLEKSKAGSGALGDIGAHIIDMARFLVGEFDEVVGTMETFIKERPLPAEMTGLSATASSAVKGKVTVDDAAIWLARFQNGAIGTFEATRFAAGRKNYNAIEINGSKGSLRFCFERMNELEYFNREDPADVQGFRTIMVTEGVHKYISAWWPAGHIIGYEHGFVHEVYELMQALAGGYNPTPDFSDGVKCQEVLAAVEKSAQERRWVKISEV